MKARIRTSIITITVLAGSLAACGAAGTTITRLAVGDPGPDAYTLMAAADEPRTTRLADSGGARTGNLPGLYGGTRRASACDKAQLTEFLQAHGDKAGAWAGVLGITPEKIAEYVSGLTPVVLRTDTLVTNHGYRDGRATAIPAVLQAGIAVLVDQHAVPVVKCNCGNPLTRPSRDINVEKSNFRGTVWPQFHTEKVTVIRAPAQEVTSLTLVDSGLGMVFDRPVGTGGAQDGAPEPMPPSAEPEPGVSTTGQPTDLLIPGATTEPSAATGDPSADPSASSTQTPLEPEQTPSDGPEVSTPQPEQSAPDQTAPQDTATQDPQPPDQTSTDPAAEESPQDTGAAPTSGQ